MFLRRWKTMMNLEAKKNKEVRPRVVAVEVSVSITSTPLLLSAHYLSDIAWLNRVRRVKECKVQQK